MTDRSKILVVDDDPDTQALLSKRLRDNGYQVVSAGDGVDAMAKVRKEAPDLIVLDLGLPAGDGFVTLERLAGNTSYSEIPVVVLTARQGDEVRKQALECGADAFFEKTASKDEFLLEVSQLLIKRETSLR